MEVTNLRNVSRRGHDPEIVGSNPTVATKRTTYRSTERKLRTALLKVGDSNYRTWMLPIIPESLILPRPQHKTVYKGEQLG